MKRRLPSRRAIILLAAVLAVMIAGLFTWKPLLLRHRISRARAALERRDAEVALENLQANQRLEPEHAETHFWLARAYRRLGRFGKVREHLERAWKLGHPVEVLKREQWLALAQSGQIQRAEPHLSELLRDPREDGRDICEAYVAGYLLNYRHTRALQLLDAWQKDYPDDAYPWYVQGKLYEGLRNTNKAIECYRRALKLDDKQVSARLRLATLLMSSHQHDEAGRHFETCLENAPDDPEVLTGWGRWLVVKLRNDEARRVLKKALELDPKNLPARLEMGELELSAGNAKEALKWLEPAVRENPYRRKLRYAFARALQRAGRTDEAKQHFAFAAESQRAEARVQGLIDQLAKNSSDVNLRFQIGMTMIQFNPVEAGTWLRSVVDIDPKHQRAHLALAKYYAEHGPPELAERHRKRAAALSSESNPSTE